MRGRERTVGAACRLLEQFEPTGLKERLGYTIRGIFAHGPKPLGYFRPGEVEGSITLAVAQYERAAYIIDCVLGGAHVMVWEAPRLRCKSF